MKRTAIAFAALLTVFAVTGCPGPAELTGPDLDAYNSQWAAERTIYTSPGGFNASNLGLGGALSFSTTGTTLAFSEAQKPDLLKITDLTARSAALKKAITFYPLTASADLLTVSARGAAISYEVARWNGTSAVITWSVTNNTQVEIVLNLDEYTHHGGQHYDLDNDGRSDAYDKDLAGASSAIGSPAGNFVIKQNAGLMSGTTFTLSGGAANAGSTTTTLQITTNAVTMSDTTDYGAKLNEIFGLEKFVLANGGFVPQNVTGIYTTGTGVFAYTLPTLAGGDVYRVVVKNWEAAKNFRGKVVYGVEQKLLPAFPDTLSASASTPTVVAAPASPVNISSSTLSWIDSGGVSAVSSTFDNKNLTVRIPFTVGSNDIGANGLSDPNAAVKAGHIRLAYLPSGNWSLSDANVAKLVFIPIKEAALEYQNSAQTTGVKDQLSLLIDPRYETTSTAANRKAKVLLISPQYKTADGNFFGDYSQYQFIYEGVNQFGFYELGDHSSDTTAF